MWKSMVNVFSSKTSSSLKCDPLKRERLQHITPMINITVCMGLMDASHKTKQKRLKALWEIHLQCLPLEEVLDMCSLVFIRRKHGIKTKSDVGLMTSSPFWTLVKSQPCYPMLTSIEYERKKQLLVVRTRLANSADATHVLARQTKECGSSKMWQETVDWNKDEVAGLTCLYREVACLNSCTAWMTWRGNNTDFHAERRRAPRVRLGGSRPVRSPSIPLKMEGAQDHWAEG